MDDHAEQNYEEDDVEGEIVITIDPRIDELDFLGVSIDEFEAALATTLDAYDRTIEATEDPDEIGALDDAEIILGGKRLPTLRCCRHQYHQRSRLAGRSEWRWR